MGDTNFDKRSKYLVFLPQETAVNIGYSCQLLTDDLLDLFVVDGSTQEEVEQQLRKFRESIKIVTTFSPGKNIYNFQSCLITSGSVPVAAGNSSLAAPYNQNNGRLVGSATSTCDSIDNATTASVPPAISVVTFRWDTINKHKSAPDR